MRYEHIRRLQELSRQDVAEFVGIQGDGNGGGFGLYNVRMEGNPLDGSTVSAETIVKMGIRVKQDLTCRRSHCCTPQSWRNA